MADGGKGPVGSVLKDINEAIVEPVVDEAGEVIKETTQSIFGGSTNPNPQQQTNKQDSKRQIEEQKKLDQVKLRNVQNYINTMEENQKRIDLEKKQKEKEEENKDELMEQEKRQIKQFEIVQKKQDLTQDLAFKQRQIERKRGGG